MELKEKVKRVVALNLVTLEPFEDKKEDVIRICEDIIYCVNAKFPELVSNIWEGVTKTNGYRAFSADTFWTTENWGMMKEYIQQDGAYWSLSDSNEIRKARLGQLVDFAINVVMANVVSYNRLAFGVALGMRREIYEECFKSEDIICIFREITIVTDAKTGLLEYSDRPASYTAVGSGVIQSQATLNYEQLTRLCEVMVPGYYWGLLLTKGHIEKLGGVEYIRKNAPCYKIYEWEIGGKTALFMQLTKDMFKISKQERLAYKEFLKPVLPEVNYVEAAREKKFFKNRRNEIIVYTEEEQKIIDEFANLSKEELHKLWLEKRTVR